MGDTGAQALLLLCAQGPFLVMLGIESHQPRAWQVS